MMLNLKKGFKKMFFLDREESEKKIEKNIKRDIKKYDQEIEELKVEVEALNKELEKMKKTAKRDRVIFIFFILGNLVLSFYILVN